MSVSAASLMAFAIPAARQTVSARDAILYALSVGYGSKPLDPAHLAHVYEEGLVSVPTLANVVAHAGPWMKEAGVDWARLVHAEHRLRIHRPLPIGIPLASRSRTLSVVDRGPGKGMFVTFERVVCIEETAEPVATVVQTNACRGDAGSGDAGTPPEPLPPVPDGPPHRVMRIAIGEDAALLYRLNGDLNPLHVDPGAAGRGGFSRPILHGLCSFGYAAYALSRMAGEPGLARLGEIAARFSAPVFPGETLEFQMWNTDGGTRFRAVVPDRKIIALDNGMARLT